MVILFFVALILAWPTAGLSILAYIVLIVAKGFFQAKERMHNADKLRAQREVNTNSAKLPSWMADRNEIQVFLYGIQNVSKRNGVPESFFESFLSNERMVRSIFQYAGAMEVQGASFIDQQRAAVEKLSAMYNNKVLQVNRLRQWMENETSWYCAREVSDDELLKTRKLVLGDAISGELRHPKVSRIPDEILLMEELEDLHLQRNDLDALPPTICNISSLKKLRLGGNGLTSLPSSIGQLKNLELLTLWSNDLINLPIEIGQLVKLKALNIAYNDRLNKLPDSIVSLRELNEFDWYGPGEKILTQEQIEWLKTLRANGCSICINDESILDEEEVFNDDDIPF